MSRSELSAASAEYLARVEELLDDVDRDERLSLLADLADQLDDLSSAEATERLGTPEEFAEEYRRSAGLESVSGLRAMSTSEKVAAAISAAALPFGVLLLFSFGGQIVFGPFALAIEWILARVSPQPLRVAWSLLAAALGGEIAYLILNLHVPAFDGFLAVVIGLVTAGLVALLFYRTTGET